MRKKNSRKKEKVLLLTFLHDDLKGTLILGKQAQMYQ